MPVWHVSVAFQSAFGPLPVETMRRKLIKNGVTLAKSLLQGVGGSRTVFTTDPVGCAIHVQAPLTDKEINMLPRGWMEVPAVDERGSYKLLKVT